MRHSINVFIPLLIALLLFLATVILFAVSTYLFYQTAIKELSAKGFWVEVNLPLLRQTLLRTSLWNGIVLVFTLSLVYFIIYFILRSVIFTPLRELYKTILKIRQGDTKAKAFIKEENEIGELAKSFNQMIDELRKYQTELEETKQVLEIKVRARTKELEELAASLEEKVKERTRELQGKIDELERFQRLAVGRELKMIELKQEIEKLKKGRK
jgi:methyl-accepting chemotaxis protein